MIKNERQYRITKSRAQKFTQTLVHLDAHPQEPPFCIRFSERPSGMASRVS